VDQVAWISLALVGPWNVGNPVQLNALELWLGFQPHCRRNRGGIFRSAGSIVVQDDAIVINYFFRIHVRIRERVDVVEETGMRAHQFEISTEAFGPEYFITVRRRYVVRCDPFDGNVAGD